MADDRTLATLYRIVYGHVANRLERLGIHEPDDAIRRDPLEGLKPLRPELVNDPDVSEAIAEAVADALDRRRPRW